MQNICFNEVFNCFFSIDLEILNFNKHRFINMENNKGGIMAE